MEKFDQFRRKNTAEWMAEDTAKANQEMRDAVTERDATDWNIDTYVWNNLLGPRKTKAMKEAGAKLTNLDEAYKWLGHELHAEAERYEAGYNTYVERLAQVAAAQGVEVKPLPINAFIANVDRYIGDDARMANARYSDDAYELYSFYGSPEAQKLCIDRVIIGDLLTEEVPVGTEIDITEPKMYKKTLKTERLARRARQGLDKQAAIDQAHASGAERIIHMRSWIQDQTARMAIPVGEKRDSYMVVSPQFAELLTSDPKENNMLPGDGRGYDMPERLNEETEKTYHRYFMRSKFEVETVTEAQNELNPISVMVEVGGIEYSVNGKSAAEVMRAILRGVERIDYDDADDEVIAKFQTLQNTKVLLPDGMKVGIGELTIDMLEHARSAKAA